MRIRRSPVRHHNGHGDDVFLHSLNSVELYLCYKVENQTINSKKAVAGSPSPGGLIPMTPLTSFQSDNMSKVLPTLPLLLLVLTPLFGQQDESPKRTGVLSSLKIGQIVSVKESGERYLITVVDGDLKLPQSHKVSEIGADFVVVEDITGLNVVRIPLTSIKAVVHFRGFEKK